MGLFVWRWGVCGGMNRGGYSSTQGSKISKPEGCGEDGDGGCSGRVSRWWGLAFVPTPPPGSPEKITKQADLSRLRALPSDWFWRASRCWSCSRGFGWFQPLALTPQDGLTAPAALTHNLLKLGPTGSHHTPLAWVTLKDTRTLSTFHFCFLISKMNINASPLTMFASEMYYGC